MAGGKRQGAGRPKGAKNKATVSRLQLAAKASEGGITPLDYMLAILRDTSQEQSARFNAAKEAAPYLHPRLATTTLEGGDKPIGIEHLLSALDGRTRGIPRSDESD